METYPLLRRLALGLLFIQILSALMTYPLQVFLISKEVSATRFLFFGMFSVLIIYLLGNANRISIRISKGRVTALLFLGVLNIVVLSSVVVNYGKELDLGLAATYVSYSMWLATIWILRDYLQIRLPSLALEGCLLLVSVCNFLAVIAQSVLWRVPQSEIIQEAKTFVGPFMRAGLVYTDCNFLGINLTVLFFLNLMISKKFLLLRNVANILLVVGIFFTFSRGNIVFFGAIYFAYSLRGANPRKMVFGGLFTITAMCALIFYLVSAFPFLFERFYSEEGLSSTEARFRQYHALAGYIVDHPLSLIIGNGPRALSSIFGEDIHNFSLGFFADFGFVGLVCIIGLAFGFFLESANSVGRYLLVFWLLESSTLPNYPGNLFIIFAITLLKVHYDRNKIGSGQVESPVSDPKIALSA